MGQPLSGLRQTQTAYQQQVLQELDDQLRICPFQRLQFLTSQTKKMRLLDGPDAYSMDMSWQEATLTHNGPWFQDGHHLHLTMKACFFLN